MRLEERFWKKVNKSDGCWEWNAALDRKGYGVFGIGYEIFRAHRVSWEISVGKIEDGSWVLHKCDNRKCVRPDHLFLGTRQDNIDDMWAKGRNSKIHNKEFCIRGHRMVEGNLYYRTNKRGKIDRRCKACIKFYHLQTASNRNAELRCS